MYISVDEMLQYLLLVFVVAAQAQDFDADILLNQPECLSMTIEKKCPNENVTFWLHNSQITSYRLNDGNISTIMYAPFNNNKIKIILHGYNGNKDDSPNKELIPEYLRPELNYNVISVDYSPVAKKPCYLQAVPNSETVADCFTQFIHLLLNTEIVERASKKIDVNDIHVVGFSLGAQIAGNMGHQVFDEYGVVLPRITALDPAAPFFYGTATKVDKTSAKFVDSFHTNSGMYGKLLPVATADFYFNYILFQKGCSLDNILCNHFRAPEFFAESVRATLSTNPLKFCGRTSPSTIINLFGTVLAGEGIRNTTTGIYYVDTKDTSPYAKDSDC